MTDDEIKRAKELAAQDAIAAYTGTLRRLVGDALEIARALDGTRDVHEALLVDVATGDAVAVRAEWSFTAAPAAVGEMAARRPEGAS